MRFRAGRSRRRTDRISLNLASMIDVTFLLLIYFLFTVVLVRSEDRLSPTLQVRKQAVSGEMSDFQPQMVDVRLVGDQPAYVLGTRILHEREALASALDALPKSAGLFINVHDRVPVGFAVAAIQLARDAGFEQVTYVPVE